MDGPAPLPRPAGAGPAQGLAEAAAGARGAPVNAPFWELVCDDALGVAHRLLELSPLSDLSAPSRPQASFRFAGRHFAAISDHELARAVCYRLAAELPVHAAGLGGGLDAALAEPGPLGLAALRLCMHVHYVAALEGKQVPAAERAAEATFYALPPVVVQRDLALLLPPGLREDPAAWASFRAHAAQCAAAAGEVAVKAAAEQLNRLFTDPARAIG